MKSKAKKSLQISTSPVTCEVAGNRYRALKIEA